MKALFTTLFVVFALSGCTKVEPFINVEYNCECGTLSLNGRNLNLRLAEGFRPDTDLPTWRYNIIADFRSDEEIAQHAPIHDLSFTVNLTSNGQITPIPAIDSGVLSINEVEPPSVNVVWGVSAGTITSNISGGSHTLTFSNVQAGSISSGGSFEGELIIAP